MSVASHCTALHCTALAHPWGGELVIGRVERRDDEGIDNRHRQKGPVLCYSFLPRRRRNLTRNRTTRRPVCLCCAVLCFGPLGIGFPTFGLAATIPGSTTQLASLLGFLASWLLSSTGVVCAPFCCVFSLGQRRVFSSFSRRLAPTSKPHQTRPRPRSFCSLARPVVLHGFAFLFRCSTAVTNYYPLTR